jgi:DNA-binding winged helix-turn-helix (wHTH) protein/Tfp pilus assembly protein PilF
VVYGFGEFELDASRFELRRAGEPVSLEPKTLEVLFYMVRNRERMVSKAELLDAVWSDVVVGESALTRVISLARRAVDDSAAQQRVIGTLARRGYRFVAAVSRIDPQFSEAVTNSALPSGHSANGSARESNLGPVMTDAYAHRWYKRGLELLRRANATNLLQGLEAFGKSIEREPEFAPAYVGHARANAGLASLGVGAAKDRYRDMAGTLRHALALDPENAAAHNQLGTLHVCLGELAQAEAEFRQALEIDPDNSEYQIAWGSPLETIMRRPRDTTRLMQEHRWRDPLDLNGAGIYAMAHAEAGRVDEAVAELESLIELDPDYSASYDRLGTIDGYMRNRQASGIQRFTKAFELDPHNPDTSLEAFNLSLDLGDVVSAKHWLHLTVMSSEEGFSGESVKYAFACYRGDEATAQSLSGRLLETFEREYVWDTDLADFRFLRVLQTIAPGRARQFYRKHFPELFESPPRVNAGNPAAAISLAGWMQRWGDSKTAGLLLDMALSVMSETAGFWYLEATVTSHLLRGETMRALAVFHDAIDARWRIPWWMRNRETNDGPLRNHPEFQSAIAKIEDEMLVEFAHLKEMEQDGDCRRVESISGS